MNDPVSDKPNVAADPSARFSADYFERLLARALALPTDSPAVLFDDPFERIAPWPLDASQPVRKVSAANTPHQTGAPAAKTATPLAALPAPVQAPPAPLQAPPAPLQAQAAHAQLEAIEANVLDAAEAPAALVPETISPAPALPRTYLNQDDLLSTADAFIRNLPLNHLPAALRPDDMTADVPSPATRHERDAVLPPASTPAPAAPTLATPAAPLVAQASVPAPQPRVQPPTPEVAAPYVKAAAPGAGTKEAPPSHAPAKHVSAAPDAVPAAPQTMIALVPQVSSAARHATELNASARFGIGQL